MKTKMKIKSYHLHFSFVILLIIFLYFYICGAASAKKSNSMISGECSATIAECLVDKGEGEEEFLMESETTKRFLLPNSPPHLTYQALHADHMACIKDCTGLYNNNKGTFTTYNRCRQGTH
ncbi:unnamed protein product [Camellia sinensis]